MAFSKQTPDVLIASQAFSANGTYPANSPAYVDVTTAIGMLVQFTATSSAAGTITVGILTSPDNVTWDSAAYPYCTASMYFSAALTQTFSFAIPCSEGVKYVRAQVVTPSGLSLSAASAVLVRTTA